MRQRRGRPTGSDVAEFLKRIGQREAASKFGADLDFLCGERFGPRQDLRNGIRGNRDHSVMIAQDEITRGIL
jgi:hypothetical protein